MCHDVNDILRLAGFMGDAGVCAKMSHCTEFVEDAR